MDLKKLEKLLNETTDMLEEATKVPNHSLIAVFTDKMYDIRLKIAELKDVYGSKNTFDCSHKKGEEPWGDLDIGTKKSKQITINDKVSRCCRSSYTTTNDPFSTVHMCNKCKGYCEVVEKKKEVKLRPELGDEYWVLSGPFTSDDVGNILISREEWGDDRNDNRFWDTNSAFFTKGEAEKELSRRQALVRIKDYIKKEWLDIRFNLWKGVQPGCGSKEFSKFEEDNKDDLEILKESI